MGSFAVDKTNSGKFSGSKRKLSKGQRLGWKHMSEYEYPLSMVSCYTPGVLLEVNSSISNKLVP